MPPDWEAGRNRYFMINWIQLRDDLGGVRAVPGGPDLPLGGLSSSGVESVPIRQGTSTHPRAARRAQFSQRLTSALPLACDLHLRR